MRAASLANHASPVAAAMAQPVSLAICSAGEIWGGVEQCILTLARGLAAKGTRPVVILFHDGLLARKLRDCRIDLEVLDQHHKYDPRTILDLRRILRSRHINVVHVHGYRAVLIGGAAARGARIKVVKTEHGRLEPISSWRDVWGHVRLSLNVLLDRIATLALVDALAYVSRDIQNVRHRRTSRIHEKLIYNGIDVPHTLERPDRNRVDGRQFNIGIVGRIDKVKGHVHLAKALARLRHLPDLRLHVFGTGPLEKEFRRQCCEAGLADRVQIHGFLEDIHRRMKNLDLLVMPSLHEGLPYTLLEAMYLKVPVLASRVGGLQEIVRDGRSGVLVEPRDDFALAAAIEHLYRNPRLRVRLADEARRTVVSRFLAGRMVDQYAELYTDLVELK